MEEQIIYQLEGFDDSCFNLDEMSQTNSKDKAQNTICEVKSEFDSCPSKYTKQNYQDLINAFGTSIINLFEQIEQIEATGGGEGNEVPTFMGLATHTKNPDNDRQSAGYTKLGIYVAQEAGQYPYFGDFIFISDDDFEHNYCILKPIYRDNVFAEYQVIKVPFPTIESTKIGEDITVQLQDGKTFGKYVNGAVIPCAEWTPEQLLKNMAQEPKSYFRAQYEDSYSSNIQANVEFSFTTDTSVNGIGNLVDASGNTLKSDITITKGKARFYHLIDIPNGSSFTVYMNYNGQLTGCELSRDGIPDEYPVKVSFYQRTYDIVGFDWGYPKIQIDIQALTIPETGCDLREYEIKRNGLVIGGDDITQANYIIFRDERTLTDFTNDINYEVIIRDEAGNQKEYNLVYKRYTPICYTVAESYNSNLINNADTIINGDPIVLSPQTNEYSFIFVPTSLSVKQFIMDDELDCTPAFVYESIVKKGSISYSIYRSYATGAFNNNTITIKYNG